ncbi:MAG: DNA mismatch repair protein MutS [Candidatus Babeliales bacterium]
MTQQSFDHTPLMKQYHAIKARYPDALLLFQVGDFYELFFEDAKRAAACLGIALTKRGKNNGEPIPLCGVPVHTLDFYLAKLIRVGFNLAICDQLEEPKPGKVVERGVTQVLTPGTLTDPKLLDAHSASYVLSFFPHENQWGLLFGELLTTQLCATIIPTPSEKLLEAELVRFFPDEVVLPATAGGKEFTSYFNRSGYSTSLIAVDDATTTAARTWMHRFGDQVYGQIQAHEGLAHAIINFYAYMQTTHEQALGQFNHLSLYQPDDFLILDSATQKNLELIHNSYDGTRNHTLLQAIDGTVTTMGSRMIKKWVMRPLVDKTAIDHRLDVVDAYMHDVAGLQTAATLFKSLGDCERIVGRIALRRATIHDYRALGAILDVIPEIINHMRRHQHLRLMQAIAVQIHDFGLLRAYMRAALNDDPTQEWLIKKGFDQRLDEMRTLVESGTQAILALEKQEQQATGIGSLKIRYNQVHGYYIEVTKTHADAIPDRYIRRQTLVGRERYTTPELENLEHRLHQAHRDIAQVEQELFATVKQEVASHIHGLRTLAHALAHADALIGLARVAYNHGYRRPMIGTSTALSITQGRHPVVERSLYVPFIANDTYLTDDHLLWIITGPNMGGKSTYLRQVALIAIMAHIGSYVPAHAATIPILDRIFTRIGAGDNLAQGKSTFLVEMEETATICNYATSNSLVILDEVGRGTSTFDGLALAQAIVEYLYTTVRAKCLFATHYHELTALSQQFPGIQSYYAASKKSPKGIVFLYAMIRGVADGSFGIEVAQLAQLPPSVIVRAQEIVDTLSAGQGSIPVHPAVQDRSGECETLRTQLRTLEGKVARYAARDRLLHALDYNELTPKAAFDLLWRFKEGDF